MRDKAQQWAAEATEQMQDTVAEVRTEQQASSEEYGTHARGHAREEREQTGAM